MHFSFILKTVITFASLCQGMHECGKFLLLSRKIIYKDLRYESKFSTMFSI